MIEAMIRSGYMDKAKLNIQEMLEEELKPLESTIYLYIIKNIDGFVDNYIQNKDSVILTKLRKMENFYNGI